jgi:hypothetical protein
VGFLALECWFRWSVFHYREPVFAHLFQIEQEDTVAMECNSLRDEWP